MELARRLGSAELGILGLDLLERYMWVLCGSAPSRRENPWSLEDPAEEELVRICFAISMFEEVFREGTLPAASPLRMAESSSDLERLLLSIPEYAVSDVRILSALAHEALAPVHSRTSADDCWAGPSFSGSVLVGGADADLLADRSLIEIKAFSRPRRLTDEAIWQLAGYVLLDIDDAYRINEVAFYAARIGWLASWPVSEFFKLLGCRLTLEQARASVARELAL